MKKLISLLFAVMFVLSVIFFAVSCSNQSETEESITTKVTETTVTEKIETTKEEVSINLKNGKYVTPKYGYTIEIDNGMITCPKKTDISSPSFITAVPVKYEIKNNRLYADKYIFEIKDGSSLILVSGLEGISAGTIFEYQA